MKLACYAVNGAVHIGRIDRTESTIARVPFVSDMFDAIGRIDEIRNAPAGDTQAHSLADVRLLAPIAVPRRNIFCVGKNYGEHAREFSRSGFEAGAVKGAELDEYPAVFSKGPNTVVGPYDDVLLHAEVTSSVDYEAELAVVIGAGGRLRGARLRHVFG